MILITKYNKCIENKPTIILPIIILHRFIWVIGYFGWIFNNKTILKIYLVFTVIILFHWFTNDWKCMLTQIENKTCDFPINTEYDYFFMFFPDLYIVSLIKLICYSIVILKLSNQII